MYPKPFWRTRFLFRKNGTTFICLDVWISVSFFQTPQPHNPATHSQPKKQSHPRDTFRPSAAPTSQHSHRKAAHDAARLHDAAHVSRTGKEPTACSTQRTWGSCRILDLADPTLGALPLETSKVSKVTAVPESKRRAMLLLLRIPVCRRQHHVFLLLLRRNRGSTCIKTWMLYACMYVALIIYVVISSALRRSAFANVHTRMTILEEGCIYRNILGAVVPHSCVAHSMLQPSANKDPFQTSAGLSYLCSLVPCVTADTTPAQSPPATPWTAHRDTFDRPCW